MVGVYCGSASCPISALLLGVELFGDMHLWAYGIMCAAAYLFTRHLRKPFDKPAKLK